MGRARNPDREALLDAAAGIVGDVGPEGLKISYVARRAGVERELAYEHFATRDELIAALNERVGQELESMLTVDANLSEFIDYIVDYVIAHPEVARLWMYQMVTDNRMTSRASLDRFHEFIAGLAKHDGFQEGVDAEVLAEIGLSACLAWSLYAHSRASRSEPPERWARRFAREFKRTLLYGVVKPEYFAAAAEDVRQDDASFRAEARVLSDTNGQKGRRKT